MVEVCAALLNTTVVVEGVKLVMLKSPPTVMVWLLAAVRAVVKEALRVRCLPTVRAFVPRARVPFAVQAMLKSLLTWMAAKPAVPPVFRVRL